MCGGIEYKAARPASLRHLVHLKLPNDSSAVSGTTNQRQPCAANLPKCSMNAWVLWTKGVLSQICKRIFLPRSCSIARSASSRLLKESSQAASPSVFSPASGRELKEGSQFYRRARKHFFIRK